MLVLPALSLTGASTLAVDDAGDAGAEGLRPSLARGAEAAPGRTGESSRSPQLSELRDAGDRAALRPVRVSMRPIDRTT
jgi:hypothetical protein